MGFYADSKKNRGYRKDPQGTHRKGVKEKKMVSIRNLAMQDFDRMWVGFDHLRNRMDEWNLQPDYPRYNVVRTGDENYLIEMDLAGWDKSDIKLVHSKKDSTLKISGEKQAPRPGKEDSYLHRGISGKSFNKEFQLVEHIVVWNAQFDNGLLKIELKLKLPEDQKPLTIDIK
jgi:molecular chaperone IbpA